MSTTSPTSDFERSWLSAFSEINLEALRRGISTGIHSAHERTARADTEYADPDGERDVYGVGMSKAAPKDIRRELCELAGYREVRIPRTSRHLMFVERGLIFPLRVGEQMRRNKNKLWLRSFSPSRQGYFTSYSSLRAGPDDLTLFDNESPYGPDTEPQVFDALRHIEEDAGRSELFVPFYSSSPRGVGQMMWAPARLDGRHLLFIEPEVLTYKRIPEGARQAADKPRPADGFATTTRPRTEVKRRAKLDQPTERD